MSTIQVIMFCLMSWFFMTLGVYLCVGLFGKKEQVKTLRPFKEFSISYLLVMLVILFLTPERDVLKQLLWSPTQGYEAIGTLSVLFMLFYSITLIISHLVGHSPTANNIQLRSGEAFLLFRGGNNEKRYLSIDVRDMASVLRSKRSLLAEIQGSETLLDATCRIQDQYEQGGYDLVIVDTTGAGYALRETLKTHLTRIPVVGALPSGPVSDYHVLPA
ncbi:hypothetical protein ACZ98_23765 (plasmid) [Vibrio parahaemolyticus]|nr:hypothetical protein ACZ98_23765 [Vibrio parahaemolyticus]